MNKKTKKKLVKQIDRTLASKASEFFLNDNKQCEKVFIYRIHQMNGESIESIKRLVYLIVD